MKKPEGADFYGWVDFIKWAKQNGISFIKGDWEAWWECWKEGYKSAMS
jgi:hypothetical protein